MNNYIYITWFDLIEDWDLVQFSGMRRLAVVKMAKRLRTLWRMLGTLTCVLFGLVGDGHVQHLQKSPNSCVVLFRGSMAM